MIPDDGADKGGGWQEARANLKFKDIHVSRSGSAREWYCDFTIGMPLRTRMMGQIDAIRAATLSEEVTEDVATRMRKDYKLPPGIFCDRFITELRTRFKSMYPDLGARIQK